MSVQHNRSFKKEKHVLVEHDRKLPLLISGKFSATFTQKDAENQWQKITIILNSIGKGENNWKMWRKVSYIVH